MKCRNSINVAVVGCLTISGICSIANARDEALSDLGGRIEYAFYAADSRALVQNLQMLEQLDVASADKNLQTEYLNYGRWKLTQLAMRGNPSEAERVAQNCADSKVTSKAPNELAVHHALVAACLAALEELRPIRSVLYRRDREAALAAALQENGKLPQVKFVAAWLTANANDKENGVQSYSLLKQVVEQYRAAESNAMTGDDFNWGFAEACYLLGKAELARTNVLAARNALEQALVLAPDYRDAQQLLQSLSLK